MDGKMNADGSWEAANGSKFRSLTAAEVADVKAMASATTPSFEGEHNAKWGDHHPLAREVWQKRGMGPKK